MAAPEIDFVKLLADVPRGAWVAISHDEQRVVSYSAQLSEAISKAHERGELDPIVMRVSETAGALIL